MASDDEIGQIGQRLIELDHLASNLQTSLNLHSELVRLRKAELELLRANILDLTRKVEKLEKRP